MKKIAIEPAPIVLALVLGYLTESNFRRALLGSGGDFTVFVTHPISLGCLVLAAGVLLLPLIRMKR
jgi:putative tricarboxylic transport membrane protein